MASRRSKRESAASSPFADRTLLSARDQQHRPRLNVKTGMPAAILGALAFAAPLGAAASPISISARPTAVSATNTVRLFGRLSSKRGCRYRSLPDQRHTARQLAQRGHLLRRKLRRGKRFDLVISGAGSRRQMGDRAKTAAQRFQPRQGRQISRGIKGREIRSQRTAREIIL